MDSAASGAPVGETPSFLPYADATAWVASAPWAAFAVDSTGRIVAANAAIGHCLGCKPSQLIGSDIAAAAMDPGALRGFLRSGEDPTLEFWFRAADGERCLALTLTRGKPGGAHVASVLDVTARRAAEDNLREERDRYLDMIRAGSDWFWESERIPRSDGTSQTKLRIIRTGPDEAVKRYEVEADWPQDVADATYDSDALTANLKKVMAGEPYRDFIHRQRRRDGKERYVRAGAVPYRKGGALAGYRGISVDVTAQVLAERALRRMQRHLEHAQRIAAIGSTERDLVTGAVEWSEQIYRILGVKRASFERTDDRILQLIHPEDRARMTAGFARARSGAPTHPAEFRIVRPDGEVRTLYAEADFEHDAQGKPIRLLTVFRDVTELRSAERKQREQLQHSQKLETLGMLASGVAHDLNNTLVPILALGKMVAKRLAEDSRERRNLDIMLQASERARDLVKQILTFSRKEAAKRERIDLAELTRQAFRMLRASVPSTIAMEQKIVAVPPLLADAGQLHQVVTNLITNAAHAIGDQLGSIVIEVAPAPGERISERTQRVCGAAVRLSVTDTGCGMDEATLARVFEPFFTTKPLGEGTGLGLSMVQGIVTQHGGVLTVASTPGQGTRFEIHLPALEAAAAALLGEPDQA